MAFRDWAVPHHLKLDNGRDYCSQRITGLTKDQRNRLRREVGPDWQKWVRRNAPADGPVDTRWIGICGELGINLKFALPYAPWSKGATERVFGRFENERGKLFITYCGDSALNKPECLDAIRCGG